MKALFALVLAGMTTASLAQAKEYTNNELANMTPKVTYACPLPNYQDFELRVMTKNTILSNGAIYRLAANEVSEPFFFEGPNYASFTVPAAFLKGSLSKIEISIGGYSINDSGTVICYRISK